VVQKNVIMSTVDVHFR